MCGNTYSPIFPATGPGGMTNPSTPACRTDATKNDRGDEKPQGNFTLPYGSNMNLNQMAFRCPDAQVVDTVRLEGYRLAFRMNGGGHGVATILPEPGLFGGWRPLAHSERDEQSLDHYEGFPRLYGKEPVTVVDPDGLKREVMAYTMNSPYKDAPALPSQIVPVRHPSRVPAERDRNRVCAGRCLAHPAGYAPQGAPPEKSPARKMARNDNSALAPVGLRIFLKSAGAFFILPKRRLL